MKRYFLYIGLIMVSLLGTDLTDFALSIWVLDQPGSSIKSYTIIWFFEAAPAVFLAPFIGSLVDRWSKKKMIVYGQLAAGIGSIILMLLHYFKLLLPWHIMVVSGIGSIANMFVFSAFYIATIALVTKNKLMKAQGISTSIYAAIGMGVPIAAPVLYKLIGMNTIFLIDIVTFSVSIIAFLILRFTVISKSEEKFSMKNDWKVVNGFLKEKKGILNLFSFFFILSFLMGLVQVLFVPLVLDFSNEYVLGIIMSVIGVGTLIGGIIMSGVKGVNTPVKIILWTGVFVGIILSFLWVDVNPYTLAIGGMIVMLLFTVSDIMNDAFFQTVVPAKMLGRLSGFEGLVVGGAAPISFLLSGFLVDYITVFFKTLSPEILARFPGTIVTPSILMVFIMSGISLILISFLYIKNKKLKALDVLYKTEIKKGQTPEKQEDNVVHEKDKLSTVDL